jgi:hypothetical protein
MMAADLRPAASTRARVALRADRALMRTSPVRGGCGVRVAATTVGIAITAVLSGAACPPAAAPPVREPSVATAPPAVQATAPVRVRIQAIGVDAPVVPLEVDARGALAPPATNEVAGWWRAGPEPGESGPAVLVGHVDSRTGPAVFFRLRQLVPGDEIAVDLADGSTVLFIVQRSERHAKNAFPTDSVYGDTPDPQLRLLTCGGDFDRSTGHYVDNVIVYAGLVR